VDQVKQDYGQVHRPEKIPGEKEVQRRPPREEIGLKAGSVFIQVKFLSRAALEKRNG
jgi:hypothetical protein